MNEESLSALDAEIERQRAAFEEAKEMLAASFGDEALEVPSNFFEQLDELAASPSYAAHTSPVNGLRA